MTNNFSHDCPSTIKGTINDDLQHPLVWFSKNSLKANPHRFQSFGLALGRSSVDFKFKLADQELKKTVLKHLELPLTTNLTLLLAYAA